MSQTPQPPPGERPNDRRNATRIDNYMSPKWHALEALKAVDKAITHASLAEQDFPDATEQEAVDRYHFHLEIARNELQGWLVHLTR